MWRPISFTAPPNMVLCLCVPVSFTGFLCGRSEKMLPGYPAKNIERTNPQRRLKLHSLDALIIVNNVFFCRKQNLFWQNQEHSGIALSIVPWTRYDNSIKTMKTMRLLRSLCQVWKVSKATPSTSHCSIEGPCHILRTQVFWQRKSVELGSGRSSTTSLHHSNSAFNLRPSTRLCFFHGITDNTALRSHHLYGSGLTHSEVWRDVN